MRNLVSQNLKSKENFTRYLCTVLGKTVQMVKNPSNLLSYSIIHFRILKNMKNYRKS